MVTQPARRVSRFERAFAALGAAAFFVFALGCMSLNFGSVETRSESSPNAETGTVTLPANQTIEVYYPNPYLATPNLRVENSGNDCIVVEQKPNYFRIQNRTANAREITWKARGEKIPSDVLIQSARQNQGTAPAEAVPVSAVLVPAPQGR